MFLSLMRAYQSACKSWKDFVRNSSADQARPIYLNISFLHSFPLSCSRQLTQTNSRNDWYRTMILHASREANERKDIPLARLSSIDAQTSKLPISGGAVTPSSNSFVTPSGTLKNFQRGCGLTSFPEAISSAFLCLIISK